MASPKIKRFGKGSRHIVYETWGDPNTDAPPLILVHGLSGSAAWWRHNLAALSADRCVYVVELIGYGRNRALKPTSIASAARALAEFITLFPAGRAHLLGHSMGGHICATCAATYPERVDHLILAAASGLVHANLATMALRLPIAAHYSPLDFLPTLAWDALRAGPLNLLLSTRDLLNDDLTATLPKIQAPTLLLWGTRDNLVPLSTGKTMAKTIPHSHLEILEGAGHVLMWDHAETFNRLVLAFLK